MSISLTLSLCAHGWRRTWLTLFIFVCVAAEMADPASAQGTGQDQQGQSQPDQDQQEPPQPPDPLQPPEEEDVDLPPELLTGDSTTPISTVAAGNEQMVGDFPGSTSMYTFANPIIFPGSLSLPIPLAGGARRIKIAENNQVKPMDRFYFSFNHFHNGFVTTGTSAGGPAGSLSLVDSDHINQHTLGFEKTLLCGCFSIDVRMPFTGGAWTGAAAGNALLEAESSAIGNLGINLKQMVCCDPCSHSHSSIGLGISVPTGSDAFFGASFGGLVDIVQVHNEAVHLMPFIGHYMAAGDRSWIQAFAQLDIPLNGNRVDVNDEYVGTLDDQALLYLDVSFGHWIFRDPCCNSLINGLAGLVELHYTTSLNHAEGFSAGFGSNFGNPPTAGSARSPGYDDQFDVLNLTAGIRAELVDTWKLNVSGVFPIRDGRFGPFGRQNDRFFDAEVVIHLNREF